MNEPAGAFQQEQSCRVLGHADADGPTNMAIDEALLEDAARSGGPAYLRTYGWTIPTLSLGYFQRLAQAHADPRFASVPLVRRLTGGGAIWHHHEVTYALVLPSNHPLARPSTELYHAVHAAIASALRGLGIAAERRGHDPVSAHLHEKRQLLCFTDPDAEDIVAKGAKVVGSAQRRRTGAVLQHGSLLLTRSSRTPELPGICDVADESANKHDWSSELFDRIPLALGLRRIDVEVPEPVRGRALELQRDRYRNPAWTGLR